MDANSQGLNLKALNISQGNQQNNVSNEEVVIDEDKFQLCQFREEHSVEIRQTKRKQILKKNRVLPVEHQEQSCDIEPALGDFSDIYANQEKTKEQFQAFVKQNIPVSIEAASQTQRCNNVQALVSLITSNCSPQFFIFATNELCKYFQDDDTCLNISIQDIYEFIAIILASNFIQKAKLILSDWRTALGLNTTESNTYFFHILRIDQKLPRSCLLSCLNILCGISRGSDAHCSIFERSDLLQLLFDIFDASKTQRDITEIMLYTIGNIAATRNQWRIFFMQRNFHNTILDYLKFAPKNEENLLLHRRICWCLSNFTRDYVSVQQNNGQSQILANGQVVNEIIDNSQFDFTHIKNLTDTFIEYKDVEIRTDIAWTFQQLVVIFFPKFNGNIIMPGIADDYKINNSLTLQEKHYYKQLVTEKIGYLIQNGVCEFINEAFKSSDMTILVPILRIINRIMAGSAPVIELFFSKCNDTILQYTSHHLQNKVQLIRKEVVKTLHYLFACEYDGLKEIWFNKLMQIVMIRFNTESSAVKEEIYKLLNTIVDKVGPNHFEFLIFGANKFCIFRVMRNSMGSYETKPEALITILSILFKVLNYYKLGNSIQENQKIKRIIQIIDQNNIPSHFEKLQEHQQEGIYQHSVQLIELYNKIQENIIEEEHTKQISIQPINQDYIRQSKFDNQNFEKLHEEQKI
ncbi:hypothetical protein ABPG73_016269 [Tetrahymena malaccensis]